MWYSNGITLSFDFMIKISFGGRGVWKVEIERKWSKYEWSKSLKNHGVENFTQFFSEVSRCLVNKMSDFKAMQNGSIGHSGDAKTQTPRLQCCVSLY